MHSLSRDNDDTLLEQSIRGSLEYLMLETSIHVVLSEEEDVMDKTVKYRDPKSGENREIKVSSALSYDKQHPAHIAALKLTGGKSRDQLDAKEKKDKEKEKTDAQKQKDQDKRDAQRTKEKEKEKGEDSAQKDAGAKDDGGTKEKETPDEKKEKERKTAQMFATSAHDTQKKPDASTDAHGDDHGEHAHKLSRKERIAVAAIDVLAKSLHIPGAEYVAGQFEAIGNTVKEVAESGKEARGILGKAKAMGKKSMSMLQEAKDDVVKRFTNSLHDKNTGQRKKMGKILLDKGVSAAKGIYTGLKNEASHISHGVKGGVEVAKKVLKEGPKSLTDEDKDKIVDCIHATAQVAVIGMAIASGPLGMSLKAGSLALNPGDALRAVLTADMYTDLERRGLISVLREAKGEHLIETIHLIDELVENFIDDLTDDKLMEIMMTQGGKELSSVDSPLNDYSEEHMDMVTEYALYGESLREAQRDPKAKQLIQKVRDKNA